ncbi:MAG: T9SS type A sorting domain-containing protein [Bacteroidia bacterium]
MKKLFTTAFALLLGATMVSAQRLADLSIQSIVEPSEITTGATYSTIKVNMAVFNDGPDDLTTSDTIFYLMQVTQNGNVITQTPNAHQLVVQNGGLLHRNVNAGDTFHFVVTLYTPVLQQETKQVDFIGAVLIRNRPDLEFESGTALNNNFSSKTGILWWNEAKWPLNVANIDKGAMTVYPNPTADVAILNTLTVDASMETRVSVYDVKGKEVYSFSRKEGDMSPVEINTRNLDNGVYIVKLDNGQVQETAKLVVQH